MAGAALQLDRHMPFTVDRPNQALAEKAAAIVRMLNLFEDSHAALPGVRAETTAVSALVGPNDERIPLPTPLYEALKMTAEILAAGGSVTIVPVEKELTTQEAADILNMSRQYLIRLLEDGALPFQKVNSHRRIRLQDLLEYRLRRDQVRHDALRKLTQITEDAGTPDTFPDENKK
jgi:excisionase family DNA binding protein